MIVVYLDWNIYAQFRDWKLKGDKTYSKYKILEELKNSGQITSYYSDAHILDLMPENNDSSYLVNDLKAISILTDNVRLMDLPLGEYKSVFNPKDIYNDVCSYFSMNLSPESIKQGSELMRKTLEPYLISTISPTTGKHSSETNDIYSNPIIVELFKEHNDLLNDPKLFKSNRSDQFKKLKANLSLRTQLNGGDSEKISFFLELFPKYRSSMPTFMLDRRNLCLAVFKLLDVLYLWADGVYKNMLIDALHAFYASHFDTDALVTDDNNFRNKAIVAYQVLGIDLPVLNFDEFLEIVQRTK